MITREYITVHRCFSLLRRQVSAPNRITFEELAILCHLAGASAPVRMSELAQYQGALRPTTTHRVGHLEALGLVGRFEGIDDRRHICAQLTEKGQIDLTYILGLMRSNLADQEVRDSVSDERMCEAIDKTGSVSINASDLILLALFTGYADLGKAPLVGEVSEALGVLQPTASMAINKLVADGHVTRMQVQGSQAQARAITLTKLGKSRAQKIEARISGA